MRVERSRSPVEQVNGELRNNILIMNHDIHYCPYLILFR